jgi:hypothetical protein
LEEVDGGIMENISINNLTMMDVWDYPIYITLGRRNRTPNATNGIARNISINNVIATGVDRKSGIQITGMPGDDIDGVRLENIRIGFAGGGTTKEAGVVPPELGTGYPEPSKLGTMPAYGLFARHVRDLEMEGIRFSFEKADMRPAMVCDDLDGLEIDDFKAQTAAQVPAAVFNGVTGLEVRNSPALEGMKNK